MHFYFPSEGFCVLKANLILPLAVYSGVDSLQEGKMNPRAFISREQESETDGLYLDHIQTTRTENVENDLDYLPKIKSQEIFHIIKKSEFWLF